MNRCDLYKATDCAFNNAANFDIYRPSKSGNCPIPLPTRNLIKNDWECGNSSLATGVDSNVPSIYVCEPLCIEEPLCNWF